MNKILLITPPFLQFNNPYPAMPYLSGYLRNKGFNCVHYDLNIHTAREIFSSKFLSHTYDLCEERKLSAPFPGFFDNKKKYLAVVDATIDFLAGKNSTFAHRIVSRNVLPEGPNFAAVTEKRIFSVFDTVDRARYLATLFIEDIAGAYRTLLDPGFEITKYREALGLSAGSFKTINSELQKKHTEIEKTYLDLLRKKITEEQPRTVAFTIPFPGNLFTTLRCAKFIKDNFPDIIIAAGGGFVNTELRGISNTDFFNYIDYLLYDDGEYPLENLLNVIASGESGKKLYNCAFARDNKVFFTEIRESRITGEVMAPDYSDCDPGMYLSMFDTENPMMRLWNDGFWNKLTLAHGCYWAKCSFCDTRLDYIKNFKALEIDEIIRRMKAAIEATGERGFHFTDEAAPPALLKKLAVALLQEGISCTWWTNVRFEKSYTPDLAKLLALSGCIAVAGGVEAASPRVLKIINKGSTIEQLARSAYSFSSAGILVHAYLMYGYPTETKQETIDSLEIVRQLFEQGCIDSAYWHRFSLTCHSSIFEDRDKYGLTVSKPKTDFCRNDVEFTDAAGIDHSRFHDPLNKALFAYMKGDELTKPAHQWFAKKSRPSDIDAKLVESAVTAEIEETGSEIFIADIPGFDGTDEESLILFSQHGDEYSMSIEPSQIDGLKKFYELYPLYSKVNIDKAQQKLASFLRTDKEGLYEMELYFFLREFSLFLI